MSFRFKQFSVDDINCPMKVGTDSVLLGAWAKLEKSRKILDIGTGCGLLALMAAQRSKATITAIDIDTDAIKAAKSNFLLSLWKNRLEARRFGLQEYAAICPAATFDHIITNPPFFINSLKAPDPERSNARHTDQLPYDLLASASAKLLKTDGRLSLVLPVNESEIFRKIAEVHGLYINNKLNIVPKKGKPANRVLIEFGLFENLYYWEENLMIRDQSGDYTNDYKEMTREFYLNF
jgi:tRNA1Val (adenine37-N6)-methyltransferase